jgi:hypothetical protein
MNFEIRDTELQARIQRQMETTQSGTVEEVLARLLETQEEQDRWLLENRAAIDEKIQRGISQLDQGKGIPEEKLASHLRSLKTRTE